MGVLWTWRNSNTFCFTNTKSFENQFTQRKESGFYTFRELHQIIRKLGTRSLLPKYVPEMLDWKALESLQGQDWRQLSNRDFLSRLKLKEDLDAACARLESSGSTVRRSWRPLNWTLPSRSPETTLPPRLVVTWFTCWKSSFQTSASMLVSSEGWVALTQSPCWVFPLIRHYIASLPCIGPSACGDGWKIRPNQMHGTSSSVSWNVSARSTLEWRTHRKSSQTWLRSWWRCLSWRCASIYSISSSWAACAWRLNCQNCQPSNFPE